MLRPVQGINDKVCFFVKGSHLEIMNLFSQILIEQMLRPVQGIDDKGEV